MLPRTIATISVAALAVLLALLTFTTPSSAGPFGLLLIFISAYLFLIGLVSFFLFGGHRLFRFLASGFMTRKPVQPITFRRAYYYSTVLAMAPVLLVGLQSVGSVGLYEVLLVVLFEVLACIYISRRVA